MFGYLAWPIKDQPVYAGCRAGLDACEIMLY